MATSFHNKSDGPLFPATKVNYCCPTPKYCLLSNKTKGHYTNNKDLCLTTKLPWICNAMIYLEHGRAWDSIDCSSCDMGPTSMLSYQSQGHSSRYSLSMLFAIDGISESKDSMFTALSLSFAQSLEFSIGLSSASMTCNFASIATLVSCLLLGQLRLSCPLLVQFWQHLGSLDVDSLANRGLDLSVGCPSLLWITDSPLLQSATR